jgi:arylsulfatase A-like enzyme
MPRPPNVLFVFSDQQRRHALGCTPGGDPVLTPRLDRFAAEGVVAEHGLACSPICTPNRGILLTGRHPTRTGVFANDQGLAAGTPTLGDLFKNAGHHTGYIGKWHIHAGGRFVPRPFRAGFDFWHATNCNHDTFTRRYWEESETPVVDELGWQPPHETDTALRFLEQRPRDRPFALFVSYTPPHNTHGPGFARHRDVTLPPELDAEMREVGYTTEMQYHAPAEFLSRYGDIARLPRRGNVPGDYGHEAVPGYYAGCTAIDHEFGRLLDALDAQGLAEDTLVVFTSDHGELLGSHGRMQKSTWHEESVGVPVLLRQPGRLAPRRLPLLFNSPDWAPTLAALAGIAPLPATDGADLSHALRTGDCSTAPQDALLAYFAMRDTQLDARGGDVACGWRGLRTADTTYVVTRDRHTGTLTHLRHDLAADPLQLHPETGPRVLDPALAARLRVRLEAVADPFASLI